MLKIKSIKEKIAYLQIVIFFTVCIKNSYALIADIVCS
jgi:hypothetical protein